MECLGPADHVEIEATRGNQGCAIPDAPFPCNVSACHYLSAHRILAVVPPSGYSIRLFAAVILAKCERWLT